jgi:hypothetical protein
MKSIADTLGVSRSKRPGASITILAILVME